MFNLKRFWPVDVDGTDDEPDDGPSLVGVRLSSTEWERRVARLEAHELDDGQSAIGELYEHPPAPVWTSEPPYKPGLWFVRIPPDGPCRVVEVWRQGAVLLAGWSDLDAFHVARSGYQFSDRPITEPVEPKR